MKTLPSVSVIIPVKNPGKIFERVLSAVCSQAYDGYAEVIIIDSGSTDGTLEFLTESSKVHKNLKLFTIPSSEFGHGKTRNFAIKKSTGELIAVITHDATPLNEKWLSNLVRPFLENEQVAGVFGRHQAYEDADIFIKRELKQHFDGFNRTPPITHYKIEDFDAYKADKNLQMFYCFFSDNNAMLRKSVWEKIPYDDVNFAEDQKWAKAILENGYIKAYADDAIVFHSHNYTMIEVFRRSFEEAVSFQIHFQHQIIRSLLDLIKIILFKIRIDFSVLLRAKELSLSKKFFLLFYRPLYNLLRFFGYFLGSKKRISAVLYSKISMDYKLQKEGKGRRAK
jgi:rhamnosyltransferase